MPSLVNIEHCFLRLSGESLAVFAQGLLFTLTELCNPPAQFAWPQWPWSEQTIVLVSQMCLHKEVESSETVAVLIHLNRI